MALDRDQIVLDVIDAVKTVYKEEFAEDKLPDPIDEDFIAEAMGKVVAAGTDVLVDAIKTSADLTDVTAGSDTVAGGVN